MDRRKREPRDALPDAGAPLDEEQESGPLEHNRTSSASLTTPQQTASPPPNPARRRMNRRRWLLLLTDQSLYSISNQLVIFAVARISNAHEIGIVSIVVGLSSLQIGALQGAIIDSSAHYAGRRPVSDYISAYFASFPIGIVSTVLLHPPSIWIAILYVSALPTQILQAIIRSAFVLGGHFAYATAIDGFAAGILILSYVFVQLHLLTSVAAIIELWLISSFFASVIGLVIAAQMHVDAEQQTTSPAIFAAARRQKSVSYGIDGLTGQLAAQAMLWEVAITIGASAAGILRLAQQALFPVTLAVNGARTALLAASFRRSEKQARVVAAAAIATVAVMAVTFAGIAFLTPIGVVVHALGSTWPQSRTLVWFFAVESSSSATIVFSGVLLRRLGRANAILRLRGAGIAMQLGIVAAACLMFRSNVAAAAAVAFGSLAAAILWLVSSQRVALSIAETQGAMSSAASAVDRKAGSPG